MSAHGFSKTAKEKIEAAGGSVTWLRGEPVPRKQKTHKAKPKVEEPEDEAPAEDVTEPAADEAAEEV